MFQANYFLDEVNAFPSSLLRKRGSALFREQWQRWTQIYGECDKAGFESWGKLFVLFTAASLCVESAWKISY